MKHSHSNAPLLKLTIAGALIATPAIGQTTVCASLDSNGVHGDGQSLSASISGDGRFVTFVSLATNLVPGDTNGVLDVFTRDLVNGTTERVSVSSAGVQGNNHSGGYRPAISSDARFVAFGASASNLVGGDTNGTGDVFVRDRMNGTTERVSLGSGGAQANGDSSSYGISLSADGRYVAFVSHASNLVSGDTNGFDDVFVRDRTNGTTERVSLGSGGAQGNHVSGGYNIAISADGRCVLFGGYASNLVPGDTNGNYDVFLRDRMSATTERMSVDSSGAEGDADSGFNGLFLSADGRFVAFESVATNLVLLDTNGSEDVFVRDRQTGTTSRVSLDSSGAQANGGSFDPSLSADGRYVAFTSGASNLVPGDTGWQDVFIRDRQNGTTARVSVDSGGAQADNDSGVNGIPISADGHFVAFASSATSLSPGDTNSTWDIFVRDRGLLYPGTFCTAGTTTHGCVPSIAGTGTPSASSGSGFTISVSAVEGQKPGIMFYGIDNAGFTPIPFGGGTSSLCVRGPAQRMPGQGSGGSPNTCTGAFALDWNAYIATHPGALGQPFTLGRHVFAQAWFRDPPAPSGSNLSNALEFVTGP